MPHDGVPFTEESMARFALLDRLRHPVWVFDIEARRVYWANPPALQVWEAASLDELCSRDMGQDMSDSVARRLQQYQSDFISHDMMFSETWTLYPNGHPRSLKVMFSGIRHQGRMLMLCEALGELQADPDTLRSAEALLHSPVFITLYQADGQALYRNPSAREQVLDPAECWQTRFVDPADLAALQQQLRAHGKGRLVARVLTRQGERWHEVSARHCRDAASGQPAVLVSEMDVSELKEAEARASYLAMHDILTGLPNRNFVQQHYPALLQQARAQNLEVALLCIDLDRFKNINDSLGHGFGDLLLVQMSERLKLLLCAGQQLARQGGDEFLLLLCAPQVKELAARLAAAIVESLGRPLWLHGQEVQLTASVGISLCADGAEDVQSHMRHADLAMYSAKEAGRNGVQFYDESMDARARSRLALEYEIRRGLENGEFEAFYQPRVDCFSGRIVGAEALARWRHPERGLLFPDSFIPASEESGLIRELDRQILAQVASQLANWQQQGRNLQVSVNLSASQFADPELPATLQQILQQSGCPAASIELEITESLLLAHDPHTMNTLAALQAMGFAIAIDDFGTGYSNLAYLQNYPLNTLKIDRSFISGLPQSSAIPELITSLCRILKLAMVAEGVETHAQLDWLREQGCQQYQGYLCSRPLSLRHFNELLEHGEEPPRSAV
ncbi:diguanylate cyclase [Aquitalea magnusonii]|nr:diguanylate cyclase [Aquitalea magnusonii]